MACQVEIASKITGHGADFLLALKGNQSTLETEVEAYFDTEPLDELAAKTTVEKGHGRNETLERKRGKGRPASRATIKTNPE